MPPFLVVAGGSRGPEASRSDGVAALEAVGAAWTMTRLRDSPTDHHEIVDDM